MGSGAAAAAPAAGMAAGGDKGGEKVEEKKRKRNQKVKMSRMTTWDSVRVCVVKIFLNLKGLLWGSPNTVFYDF